MPSLYWTDRTWKFDFPTEVYPSILERLRGTPARLEEAVAGLEVAALTRRDESAWSIQMHAGHLFDLEVLPRTRLDEFLEGAETLAAADMSNRTTDDAQHNARPIAEILAAFRKARTSLLARLDALPPEDFARTALHPRLQTPMRLVDMCTFQADHDDHHLATISEMKRGGS